MLLKPLLQSDHATTIPHTPRLQIPANASLYARLSNPKRHGVYQATRQVLQSSSRLVSGMWLAYCASTFANFNCVIWTSCIGLNAPALLTLFASWRFIDRSLEYRDQRAEQQDSAWNIMAYEAQPRRLSDAQGREVQSEGRAM